MRTKRKGIIQRLHDGGVSSYKIQVGRRFKGDFETMREIQFQFERVYQRT